MIDFFIMQKRNDFLKKKIFYNDKIDAMLW